MVICMPHRAVMTWSPARRSWVCERCALRVRFLGGTVPAHRCTGWLRSLRATALRVTGRKGWWLA